MGNQQRVIVVGVLAWLVLGSVSTGQPVPAHEYRFDTFEGRNGGEDSAGSADATAGAEVDFVNPVVTSGLLGGARFNNTPNAGNSAALTVQQSDIVSFGSGNDGDFAIAAWVRLDAVPTATVGIIDARGASNGGWHVSILSDLRLRLRVEADQQITINSDFAIPADGTWQHVSITMNRRDDGSYTARTWLNGNADAAHDGDPGAFTGVVSANQNARIGVHNGTGGELPGELGLLQIYNTRVDQSDAAALAVVPTPTRIEVPSDVATVQGAIDLIADDAASEIILAPMNHAGGFTCSGKAFTLRSQDPSDEQVVDQTKVVIDTETNTYLMRCETGETSDTVIRGVSVRGSANFTTAVGGLLINGASPTIDNCIIEDGRRLSGGGVRITGSNAAPLITGTAIRNNNGVSTTAGAGSGGVFINGGADPTFIDCRINGNDGYTAGGLYVDGGSSAPMFIDCTFNNNCAGWSGGGMSITGNARPEFVRCEIRNNDAGNDGGGVDIRLDGNPTFVNCLIAGNTCDDEGGAVYVCDGAPVMTNCTVADNTATDRGGGISLCNGSGVLPVITNTIIWRNTTTNSSTNDLFVGGAASPVITYTNSRDAVSGTGNLSVNPRFEDPGEGDYRLRFISTCIDAGNNSALSDLTDLDGQIRFDDLPTATDTGSGSGPIVDMGAYEYQSTADADGDTVPDYLDVCPDADDTIDSDADGVPDGCDACEGSDDSFDADSDGVADGCDVCSGFDDALDADADGVPDGCDACPGFDDAMDADGDGTPDACEPPLNDLCADAIEIGEGTDQIFDSTNATGDDLGSCVVGDTTDIWFRYIASGFGVVRINTNGSDFNTTLAAFSECGGTELACNDNGGSGNLSRIDIAAGSDPLILRVAGANAQTGVVELNVTLTVCPCEYDGDTSAIVVGDLLAFLRDWFDLDLNADLNGSGAVEIGDLLEFLGCWFDGGDVFSCV